MKLKTPNKSFSSHCDYFSHKITFSFRRKQQQTLYYCCLFTQRYMEKQDDKCLGISRSTETILRPWNGIKVNTMSTNELAEFCSSYKLEYQVWKTLLNRVNKQGRCQLRLQARISSFKDFTYTESYGYKLEYQVWKTSLKTESRKMSIMATS